MPATLDKLGIASVYDLRTPGEIARTADILPAGATSQALDVLGTSDFVAPTFDDGRRRRRVHGSPGARLCHRRRPACRLRRTPHTSGRRRRRATVSFDAGKDRAGWVAALLLSIANVPLDVIMQDYLLSNVYLAQSIQAQTATLRAQDGDAVATVESPVAQCSGELSAGGFRSGAGELRHDGELSDARPGHVSSDDRYVARPAGTLSVRG